MRWKYAHLDPGSTSDPGRQDIETKIAAWWKSFGERVDDLDALFMQRSSWDLASWMQTELQAIHPKLMWEYGSGVKGGHRLVITPEAEHQLRPLVDQVLAGAPTIDGWEFYQHRIPEPHAMLAPTISGRCGSDLILTGAAAERGEFNRVNLTFTRKQQLFRRNHDQAMNQAFVTAETLLGEERLDQWIGLIDVVKHLPQPVLLPALASHIDVAVRTITESLPQLPYHRRIENLGWSTLELKPESADDYTGREDLLVAVSADVELWRACHDDPLFSSSQFSGLDETFCYLKIDGAEGLKDSSFEDRGDIDDAISAALSKEGLGCTVGGGTGLRYSYLDLALLEPTRSIPLIQHVLQEGGIPRRTWFLFFDAALQTEWVRVRPDAPVPP